MNSKTLKHEVRHQIKCLNIGCVSEHELVIKKYWLKLMIKIYYFCNFAAAS